MAVFLRSDQDDAMTMTEATTINNNNVLAALIADLQAVGLIA